MRPVTRNFPSRSGSLFCRSFSKSFPRPTLFFFSIKVRFPPLVFFSPLPPLYFLSFELERGFSFFFLGLRDSALDALLWITQTGRFAKRNFPPPQGECRAFFQGQDLPLFLEPIVFAVMFPLHMRRLPAALHPSDHSPQNAVPSEPFFLGGGVFGGVWGGGVKTPPNPQNPTNHKKKKNKTQKNPTTPPPQNKKPNTNTPPQTKKTPPHQKNHPKKTPQKKPHLGGGFFGVGGGGVGGRELQIPLFESLNNLFRVNRPLPHTPDLRV